MNHRLLTRALSAGVLALTQLAPPSASAAPSAGLDDGVTIAAEMARMSGVVKAYRRATLSSELTARITDMPFREGDPFKASDTLVTFDCAIYDAQLRAKRAERDAKDKTYQTKKHLKSLNAAGELDVQLAKAELNVAIAEAVTAMVWVKRCRIDAPYDGRVVARHAHKHETTSPGQRLLEIVDRSAPEVEIIVPSNWVRDVKVDQHFRFRVEETGKAYPAVVTGIAAAIDAASQTLKITARLGEADDVIPGMSGVADFGTVAVRP